MVRSATFDFPKVNVTSGLEYAKNRSLIRPENAPQGHFCCIVFLDCCCFRFWFFFKIAVCGKAVFTVSRGERCTLDPIRFELSTKMSFYRTHCDTALLWSPTRVIRRILLLLLTRIFSLRRALWTKC